MDQITNNTSLLKIPPDLLLLLDEVTAIYNEVFGSKLVALYLAGSIPHGQFQPRQSDADFYGIVDVDKISEYKVVLNKKMKELGSKWSDAGVTSVDGAIIPQNKLQSSDNKRTAFILGTDAILISGNNLNLAFAVPNTPKEIANILNEKAKLRLSKIEYRLNINACQEKDGRRVVKLAIRCAFGVAIINGAKYTPDYQQYPALINVYVPEVAKPVHEMVELSRINIKPTVKMIELAKRIVKFAEQNGIIFL